MTPRPRKLWSTLVTESGVSVRLYERTPGGTLYRDVWTADGKDRQSLGHANRRLAEEQVRALARRLAELRNAGAVGPLTMGQGWALYQEHWLPLLSPSRQAHVRQHAAFCLAHFGRAFRLDDLSQSHVDAFAAARRSGLLRSRKRPAGEPATVRDGTIRQNLNWLAAMLRWARDHRVNGWPLMTSTRSRGSRCPKKRTCAGVASADRCERTMRQAAAVHPTGRFACVLALVRHAGRQINAVCQLRASDLLLSRETILRALAAAALDERLADHMRHGAILWRSRPISSGSRNSPLSLGLPG